MVGLWSLIAEDLQPRLTALPKPRVEVLRYPVDPLKLVDGASRGRIRLDIPSALLASRSCEGDAS